MLDQSKNSSVPGFLAAITAFLPPVASNRQDLALLQQVAEMRQVFKQETDINLCITAYKENMVFRSEMCAIKTWVLHYLNKPVTILAQEISQLRGKASGDQPISQTESVRVADSLVFESAPPVVRICAAGFTLGK